MKAMTTTVLAYCVSCGCEKDMALLDCDACYERDEECMHLRCTECGERD